jgi:endonuclease III
MGCTPTRNLQDIAGVFDNIHKYMKDMYENFIKSRAPIEGKDIMLVTQEIVNNLKVFQEGNDKLKVEFDKLSQMIKDYPFMKAYASRTPKVCNVIELMKKSGQDITEGFTKIMQLKDTLSAAPKIEVKPEIIAEAPQQIDLVNPLSLLNNQNVKTAEQIASEENEMKEKSDKMGAMKKSIEETFEKLIQYLEVVSKKFPMAILIAKVLSDRAKIVHEKDQFGTLMDGIENLYSCVNEMASKLKELQIN